MSKVNVNDFSDRSDSDMGDAARRQGWNSSAFSTTRTEEYTTGPYKSIINPAFSAGEDAIRDFLQQERGAISLSRFPDWTPVFFPFRNVFL